MLFRSENKNEIFPIEVESQSNLLNVNLYNIQNHKFRIKCYHTNLQFDFIFNESKVIKYDENKELEQFQKVFFTSQPDTPGTKQIYTNIKFLNNSKYVIYDKSKWVFFKVINNRVILLVSYDIDKTMNLKFNNKFFLRKSINPEDKKIIDNNEFEKIESLIKKYYDIIKFYSNENYKINLNIIKENESLIPKLNIIDNDYINDVNNIINIEEFIWLLKAPGKVNFTKIDYSKIILENNTDLEGIIKLKIIFEANSFQIEKNKSELESNPIEIINDKKITEESINVNKSFLFSLLMNNKNINYEKIIGLIL